ncbi:hypothetical protein EGW08_011650 [Elysia chlorotica]|uniref:Major facilitator superfamily (MFS) profile domain-containing protein n=1 Tax=Elysia chlorotica TaxID=188477 RepID=A0A433TGA0_ELYCH|nr:hypothetical protein EGW08_011650 [Elysia chlorotica]
MVGHEVSARPHQQQPSERRPPEHHPHQETATDGVGTAQMVMLVAAMSGIEAVMAFEQIYEFLMLQYLGTPVALMSTSGVIAGASSLTIMPGLTYFVNRGAHSWKRKWYAICLGLTVFLLGLILLISAGIIKIINLSKPLNFVSNLSNSSMSELPNSGFHSSPSSTMSFVYDGVPATAILGMISFGLTGLAYDLGAPAVKSFALDTLPTHQHKAALATSTMLQGLGGTAITIIGAFDLPTIVENNFKMDGIAGTLLLMCVILVLTLVMSFAVTLISGKVIGLRMRNGSPLNGKGNRTKKLARRSFEPEKIKNFKYSRLSTSSTESYALRLSYANSGDILYLSYENRAQQISKKQIHTKSICSDEKQSLLGDSSDRNMGRWSGSCSNGGNQHSEREVTRNQWTQTSICSHPFGLKKSESLIGGSGGHIQTRTSILRKKHFIITCISAFLGNGCLLCFSLYSPNTLTFSILKGDPLALPGSTGRQLYEKGMRFGAAGIMIMYFSMVISSMCSHQLMKMLGEKPHYLTTCGVVAISIAVFLGTQKVEAFFVAMMFFGSFRSCCLTTPFINASKIVSEENLDNETDGGRTMGRAISLVGMMMPGHYLLLSSAMGPLIDATDNVWVPIIYSLVVLVASGASLLLLYCVRR